MSDKAPNAGAVSAALLAWMPTVRRDLPWRRRRDPYAVWISEVMLQQTQVATVIPYFERWMLLFPNVAALADAPQDAVLKAWEGLGYYARARNLQRAAQEIVRRHGGEIPREAGALRRLPGIGRYTAGAILSLAFGQPEPVLDGNVRRVLCRVYDIAEDPRAPATERVLWALAEALVRAAERPGELNEAMMELGALVCVPGIPDCPACPLQALCLARQRGVETERPVRTARRAVPHVTAGAAVIQDADGRYLIAQRVAEGLLGGLWEFPGSTIGAGGTGQAPGETLSAFLKRELAERLGIEVAVGEPLAEVRHGYTHFRLTLQAFRCRLLAGQPVPIGYAGVRWVSPGELAQYPFPVTHLKIMKALGLV